MRTFCSCFHHQIFPFEEFFIRGRLAVVIRSYFVLNPMLFVSNKYDVQINAIGMKIMGHCFHHNSPLLQCGTSAATTSNKTITTNKNNTTTTISISVPQGNRYACWQQSRRLGKRNSQFPLTRCFSIKNSDINQNDYINPGAIVRLPVKKRSLSSSVNLLQLRQGSLFKKKQQQQRIYNRKHFLNWRLNSNAI